MSKVRENNKNLWRYSSDLSLYCEPRFALSPHPLLTPSQYLPRNTDEFVQVINLTPIILTFICEYFSIGTNIRHPKPVANYSLQHNTHFNALQVL